MNASVFYTQLTYCTLRSCNYLCVSKVFIYFYFQVWNSGAWCFDLDFFHFSNFSVCLFCIITTLIFFIVSLCPCLYHLTQLVPNVTYMDSFVCRDELIGKTRTHTKKLLRYHLWKEKQLVSNTPLGSKWQWQC